jgi:hypothetical protein
VIFGLLRLLCI